MRPDLRRIEFIKEEKGGYSKKYRVRDGSGREWVAKIGKEAQSETSAVRLLWGLGYVTEVNYLVPRVTIPGKGTFTNVRFVARPDNWKRGDEWKWKKNPFVGTPEFQGLKIMMALVNNWDLKDSNNEMIELRGNNGNELRYIISDLGATFGHASTTPLFWRFTRSRNSPTNYAKSDFLEKVKGDRIVLHFGGKNRGLMKDISIQDAQWIGSLLSQLTDRQLSDAFRAANYTPDQINLLVREVRERTSELLKAASSNVLRFKLDSALPEAFREKARVTGRIVQLPAHDAHEIEQYLAQIREAGLRVEDVEIRKADLEDVFLDVMAERSAA